MNDRPGAHAHVWIDLPPMPMPAECECGGIADERCTEAGCFEARCFNCRVLAVQDRAPRCDVCGASEGRCEGHNDERTAGMMECPACGTLRGEHKRGRCRACGYGG